MTLQQLIDVLTSLGATAIYAKPLAENDNSKQQIYLGGSFDALGVLPFGEIVPDTKPKTPNFKAAISLEWLGENGSCSKAPGAQLILYPEYPEVRLSGFLLGSRGAPAKHLRPVPKDLRQKNNEPDGRVLYFGIVGQRVVCHLAAAEEAAAKEFFARRPEYESVGVFARVDVLANDTRTILLTALSAIRLGGWHESRRLLTDGTIRPYQAPNGAGYTLEALLGIAPNGRPLPDFLDWEVKAHGDGRITLMTPEPDGGFYGQRGLRWFLQKYCAPKSNGDLYFTGGHRFGALQSNTGMTASLVGFDAASGKITDVNGGVVLLDEAGELAAAWSYPKLITHWAKKHASAAYVPYERRKAELTHYRYVSPVHLGKGTHFERFLGAFHMGNVVYDPGARLSQAGSLKGRSQFRTTLSKMQLLYDSFEAVEI